MKFVITILCLITCSFYNAKIVLPEIFSDYMVLQQNSSIKIWGQAKAHKHVKVKMSWSSEEYKCHVKKDGSWTIALKTPTASFSEHTITLSESKSSITIKHVLIGEVWFCSGQSNMEMTFKGYKDQPIENADKMIAEADPNRGIRMLKVKRNGQAFPVKTVEGKWMNSTQENLPNFSAVAYFFGLKLRQELNVPIGLINCSWGGSSVEGWMNRELVEKYTDFDLTKVLSESETWKKPYVMYNGMISPLTEFIIKGFLWYQGESNINRHATYASKLQDMVDLWRKDWKLGELPFYLVEITPCIYEDPVSAAKLREAQFKATQMISNSGMVSTNDLVGPEEAKTVHPKRKQPIGERLANMALKQTYERDTICGHFSSYKSMISSNDKILLTLKNQTGGLRIETSTFNDGIASDSLIGFEIAGNDHVFHPAKATLLPYLNDIKNYVNKEITYDLIEVSSANVSNPEAVRYAFKTYAIGNLRNQCDLPVIPFRTDNWKE